ncbi:uncharacterized protein LOC115218250 [Argonauta hians]
MFGSQEEIPIPAKNVDSRYAVDVVGTPLTKAIAEIVMKQPLDPIDYLARWLYKYKENQIELQKLNWEEQVRIAHEEYEWKLKCEEEARLLAIKREEERLRQIELEKERQEEERRREIEAIEKEKLRKKLQKQKDINGQTVLHHIAGHAGADFSELYDMYELLSDRDIKYRTPRDVAMQENLEENVAEIDKYLSTLILEENLVPLKQLLLEGYPYIQSAIDLLQDAEIPESSLQFLFTISEIQEKRENIFKAVSEGDEEGFHLLLVSMPELISCRNNKGQTLLHVATLYEEMEIIKYILEISPESHKAKDNIHRTPLHYCYAISENLVNLFPPYSPSSHELDALNKAPEDYLEDPSYILALKKEDSLSARENADIPAEESKNESE